jgi:hypothetical protein
MLSFHVTNLLVPGDPNKINLTLPSGTWTLERQPNFDQSKEAIAGGQCAETYFLENPVPLAAGAAVVDRAFAEITPTLLAASYLTGLSVTVQRSTMGSEVPIMHASEHWPRARALDQPSPVISSAAEFSDLAVLFVQGWSHAGQTEKARLLAHHWLDALGCWSMEDLYLSATTLLQVIVATEATKQRKRRFDFYPGVAAAAKRMKIRTLSDDFKNMRNELIHDGPLISTRFHGPDKAACAVVVAEVLNWFDEYIHVALGLGAPRRTRFGVADFMNLNAYSID